MSVMSMVSGISIFKGVRLFGMSILFDVSLLFAVPVVWNVCFGAEVVEASLPLRKNRQAAAATVRARTMLCNICLQSNEIALSFAIVGSAMFARSGSKNKHGRRSVMAARESFTLRSP